MTTPLKARTWWVRFTSPLMVGESYKVTGEILSLVRKLSRKLGVMDVLTYRLRLHRAAGGDALLETDNVWVQFYPTLRDAPE